MKQEDFFTTPETMKIYQQEVDDWFAHLNGVYGMVFFGFTLAVLGTPMPALFACLAIPVIGTAYTNAKKFPPHISKLRQKVEEDEGYKPILKMIESHFFSIRRVFKDGIGFLIGFISFFSVFVAYIPHDINMIIEFFKKWI